MKRNQTGLSLIGLLIVAAILGFLLLIGMRTVPAVNEYFAVKRIITRIVADVGPDTTPSEIRESFRKNAMVEYLDSVTAQDLVILRRSGGYEISLDYAKKVPIAGNVSLLLEFSVKERSSGGR